MNSIQNEQLPMFSQTKGNIALIADAHDWAFAQKAVQISKYLSDEFNFEIFFSSDYESNLFELLQDVRNFDLVHFFWRESLSDILDACQKKVLCSDNQSKDSVLIENILNSLIITTSISDHLLLDKKFIEKYGGIFNFLTVGYNVTSNRLMNIYSEIESFPEPDIVTENGVDLALFSPRNLPRLIEKDREIIVGWAGKSLQGRQTDDKDHKGLETIIKEAVNELKDEGINIRGEYIDYSSNIQLPFDQMAQYYNSIDIYVCASDFEGTPNPIMEAMACGLPVVSTDVGVIPEIFGPLQSEFISERNVNAIKEKLRLLVINGDLRQKLSSENLQRIQSWSWHLKSEKWRDFFRIMLSSRQNQRLGITGNNSYDRFWNTRKLYINELVSANLYLISKSELDRTSSELWTIKNSMFYKLLGFYNNSITGLKLPKFIRRKVK